jgi:hypothetical protein
LFFQTLFFKKFKIKFMKIFSSTAVCLAVFSAICFSFLSTLNPKDVSQNLGQATEIQTKEMKMSTNNDVAFTRAAYKAAVFAAEYAYQASCRTVLLDGSVLVCLCIGATPDRSDTTVAQSRLKAAEARMAAL